MVVVVVGGMGWRRGYGENGEEAGDEPGQQG